MSSFSQSALFYEGVGNKEDFNIGKEINKQNNIIKDDEILNPATGRYVLKTGKIGKKILEDLENSNKIIYKQHLPPNNLPYTNWITYPNFLVGTYPRNEDVDKIKKLDINIFISLLEEQEKRNLYEFRDDIVRYNYPIVDRKTTNDDRALKIAKNIFNILEDRKKVYLHCEGGKGRTGTIAAIILMLQGKTLKESLSILKTSIKSRKIQGRFAKMPQTKVQLNQLERIEKILNN
jgi:protein-tyrosine phosphatase